MNEIVILSDGRVTTCCRDPLGVNVFGNIYEEDFSRIQDRYRESRRKIAEDVDQMPRCGMCYHKIKAAAYPPSGTYKVNPSEREISKFYEKESDAINRMVIEPTSLCNLKCHGCMQSREEIPGHRFKERLDLTFLYNWMLSGMGSLKKIRFYNYGETFLHPQSISFCESVKGKNPGVNISIATNGMLLNTPFKRRRIVMSGVNELIFSIHGASQKVVQIYMTRRFDFEKMMMNLKELVAIKESANLKLPRLIWKYLLFSWNDSDEEIDRAISFSQQIGLDGIRFETVGYPSPSKRYTPGSDALNRLRGLSSV